ncbi:hypothetical protein GTA08_BOTSDO12855 [Neofusicoccum parvum]|uniref:Uncharacterized protein n=1 Tax=Botryosphaeria parva (strain UCR-NP2) TaxID=1287680 RepID=R1GFB9_BOTPV|nr:putative protein of unknown function DUF1746 fungi protein [Neofusicoccum parvum UCRNP2]GME41624.1 hypothetical protein GTA08_BOTSDO12855 [Neofusicoccum parvum]
MSDDASPSTADWPRRPGSAHDPEPEPDRDAGESVEAPNEAAILAEQKKKIRSKRIGYLDDLLRNLDILIYAEISAVYYLE